MAQKGQESKNDAITAVTAAIHNWLSKLDDKEYERVMQEAQQRSYKSAYHSPGDKSAVEYYSRK